MAFVGRLGAPLGFVHSGRVLSSAELWSQVLAGDTSAFANFYEMHASRVFRHCFNRLGQRADAEDITAEVFAIAWRSRTKIRLHPQADLLPWLLKTANNLLAGHHRGRLRARRLLHRIPASEEPDIAVMHEERDERARAQLTALSVLHALKPRDREIIELAVIQNLSSSAIADAIGIPASTARARLARALERARKLYAAAATGKEVPE
jgi:RNA polymerase sigma-70 factor (ECF subfamily)